MKRILFALLTLSLGGCATTWPESASINPQINDQPDNIYSGNAVAIDNQDTRVGSQIIKIKIKKEPVVLLANNVSPASVLADRLGKGLTAQGAQISAQGDTHLTLIVEQLQSEITKPGLVYKSRVNLQVKVKAERNGASITKEFRKSAMKESATQPDIGDIELQLNEHLSSLLEQILQDSQLRNYIKGSSY